MATSAECLLRQYRVLPNSLLHRNQVNRASVTVNKHLAHRAINFPGKRRRPVKCMIVRIRCPRVARLHQSGKQCANEAIGSRHRILHRARRRQTEDTLRRTRQSDEHRGSSPPWIPGRQGTSRPLGQLPKGPLPTKNLPIRVSSRLGAGFDTRQNRIRHLGPSGPVCQLANMRLQTRLIRITSQHIPIQRLHKQTIVRSVPDEILVGPQNPRGHILLTCSTLQGNRVRNQSNGIGQTIQIPLERPRNHTIQILRRIQNPLGHLSHTQPTRFQRPAPGRQT